MANTMTPAQQQQAAIEARLAAEKDYAKNPRTGGPAPEMPVVGGIPKVSSADKARAAAELAKKMAANKPMLPKVVPRPSTGIPDLDFPYPMPISPKITTDPVRPAPNPKPIAPPVTPIAPKPTTPQQPAYGGGTGQSGMGMGVDGGFKKGGSVKSYTDKSGRINLGSGRVSTHTPSKKNSNW